MSVVVFLQMCSLEYFHLQRIDYISYNDFKLVSPGESNTKSKDATEIAPDNSFINAQEAYPSLPESGGDGGSLLSLEEILKRAGVEVTDEIRNQLPPKENFASMYGSEPIIVGLERCERFQNTVDLSDAYIGPAGMFNTVSVL